MQTHQGRAIGRAAAVAADTGAPITSMVMARRYNTPAAGPAGSVPHVSQHFAASDQAWFPLRPQTGIEQAALRRTSILMHPMRRAKLDV